MTDILRFHQRTFQSNEEIPTWVTKRSGFSKAEAHYKLQATATKPLKEEKTANTRGNVVPLPPSSVAQSDWKGNILFSSNDLGNFLKYSG